MEPKLGEASTRLRLLQNLGLLADQIEQPQSRASTWALRIAVFCSALVVVTVARLREGRVAVDVVALVALLASLVMGEALAGAIYHDAGFEAAPTFDPAGMLATGELIPARCTYEALIATGFGLLVAIPAVIMYNLLLRKVKVLVLQWEIRDGR